MNQGQTKGTVLLTQMARGTVPLVIWLPLVRHNHSKTPGKAKIYGELPVPPETRKHLCGDIIYVCNQNKKPLWY